MRLDDAGLFGGASSKGAVAGVAGMGAAAGLLMVAMLWGARVAFTRRRCGPFEPGRSLLLSDSRKYNLESQARSKIGS